MSIKLCLQQIIFYHTFSQCTFLPYVSMTSEHDGPHFDTFLTVMHLLVITGDWFRADFAHPKQAYWLPFVCTWMHETENASSCEIHCITKFKFDKLCTVNTYHVKMYDQKKISVASWHLSWIKKMQILNLKCPIFLFKLELLRGSGWVSR